MHPARSDQTRVPQPPKRLSRLGLLCLLVGLSGSLWFAWQQRNHLLLAEPSRPPVVIKPVLPKTPAKTAPSPAPVQTLPASVPTSLRINSLSIKTPLKQVGLDKTGAIIVPTDYHQAGWYNGSPSPGQKGPAIIVGHVDNRQGLGVFWRLGKLQPGALIQISRADGKVATFRVDQIKQYPQNSLSTDEVYGDIDYAGLRLITCSGTFNRKTRSYSHNTVIFASLVP